jgi:tetratricopeptide (TPR) repeat protein
MRSSLDLERSVGTLANSAFAAVITGDAAGARKLLAEAARLPGADAADARHGIELVDRLIRRRQGEKVSVDALPAETDAGDTGTWFTRGMFELGDGHAEAAAAHFKQVIDYKPQTLNTLKPLALLYYGRALAGQGKIDESRQAYERFFEAWKNADAGLPVLVEAHKEYLRLGTRTAS